MLASRLGLQIQNSWGVEAVFEGLERNISKRDQQLPRYAKEDRFDITIVLTVLP
jgi:hypothetical protein